MKFGIKDALLDDNKYFYKYVIQYFRRKHTFCVLLKLRFTSVSYTASLVLKIKVTVRPYTVEPR